MSASTNLVLDKLLLLLATAVGLRDHQLQKDVNVIFTRYNVAASLCGI